MKVKKLFNSHNLGNRSIFQRLAIRLHGKSQKQTVIQNSTMEKDGKDSRQSNQEGLPNQPDGRLQEISRLVTSVEGKLETVKTTVQEAQEEMARIKNLLNGLSDGDMPRGSEPSKKPLPDFPNNFPDDPDEPQNPFQGPSKNPFWDKEDFS